MPSAKVKGSSTLQVEVLRLPGTAGHVAVLWAVVFILSVAVAGCSVDVVRVVGGTGARLVEVVDGTGHLLQYDSEP